MDTGLNTKTAGRLRRVQKFIGDEAFMLTYGDGLTDMNLQDLAAFHSKHGKIATATAIQPEGKFGGMQLAEDNTVLEFQEKPKGDGRWINAGFFVLSPQVFNYLDETSDDVMWEDDPMTRLTNDHELVAYKYDGFWKCMDAMRDRIELENLWNSNQAKWHLWEMNRLFGGNLFREKDSDHRKYRVQRILAIVLALPDGRASLWIFDFGSYQSFALLITDHPTVFGDILDTENLKKIVTEFRPDIVFHMAAQSLVRESYANPLLTYQTNCIGTLNVLQASRSVDSVRRIWKYYY